MSRPHPAQNDAPPLRLAMWSGPRNVSTALMRSWDARPDTVVCDEPLYASYLKTRDERRHPGFELTLAAHPTDWRDAVAELLGPLPPGKHIQYQKQMAHHLLPGVGRDWVDGLTNCLLIRRPAAVLASLTEFFPNPRPADTGLPQQVELLEREAARTGRPPVVIDAADLLADPRGMLRALCDRVGVAFDERMLRWAPGPRPTDGAWGPLWYQKVYQTTSFGAPRPDALEVLPALRGVLEECQPLYERLAQHRLLPAAA